MPIFGKHRVEFSSNLDTVCVEFIRDALNNASQSLTLELTEVASLNLAKIITGIDSSGGHKQISVRAYNDILNAQESKNQKVLDNAIEGIANESFNTYDISVIASSIDLALKTYTHSVAKLVGDLASALGTVFYYESRVDLIEYECEAIKKELIAQWERELEQRRRERAEKRAREEAEEWEKIRSMDASQRALEIFEIAEALKGMKQKSAPSEMTKEQEENIKRRQAEEDEALAQDAIDDKKKREEIDKTARDQVVKKKVEEYQAKIISISTLAAEVWLTEHLGQNGDPSGFERQVINVSKELVKACDSDGDADAVAEVLSGREIGKATRDILPQLSSVITSFGWD